MEKRESAKRNALIYNISRGENRGKLRIFVSVSGAWRGRPPFSERSAPTCAVGNSALLPPVPVVRRTSSVGRSPTRRSGTAPAIHRTRKTEILCTALRDYALKAAVQHIKHRGKSASTGRIAQYPSQFFTENRQPCLPKSPIFTQKSPYLGHFRGVATRSARSLHFEIDTKRLLLQRKYKIRPLIHVFLPRHSQSHTQSIGRRAVPFCGLRRHCARAPARGSRSVHGPFLGRCGHPSFSPRH